MYQNRNDQSVKDRKSYLILFFAYVVLSICFALMMWFKPVFLDQRPEFPYLLIAGWGMIIYGYFFRLLKLEYFGIENIQSVGAKLSVQWREQVWENGKLSIAQWDKAKRMANQ